MSEPKKYEQGQRIVLFGNFFTRMDPNDPDSPKQPADPTTVLLYIRRHGYSEVLVATYDGVDPSGTITRIDEGKYKAVYTFDLDGMHYWRFEGTEAVEAVAEGALRILTSRALVAP